MLGRSDNRGGKSARGGRGTNASWKAREAIKAMRLEIEEDH